MTDPRALFSFLRRVRSGEWFGATEYEAVQWNYAPAGNYGPCRWSRQIGWPLRWWLSVKWSVRRV